MTSAAIATPFQSILRPGADAGDGHEDVAQPGCFHDLNLDQVVAAIDAAWPDEHLATFYHAPLPDGDAVAYRQEVLRDLEQAPLREALAAFVAEVRQAHAGLAEIEKLYYAREKQRARLASARRYCIATQALTDALQQRRPASRGLRALAVFVQGYTASDPFKQLATDADACLTRLAAVHYNLVIRDGSVTVRTYEDEAEASVDIENTFARFRDDQTDGAPPRRHHGRIGVNGLNHIEAQVLDKVALLSPEPFAQLDTFCEAHARFIDPVLARFAREICFYLAWLTYTDPIRRAGLHFCLPQVDAEPTTVEAGEAFDVALAAKLVADRHAVVCNGFALRKPAHIVVVSGPNHGGKTTFARMFGQLHWLAALGLSVPGTHARTVLFDHLLTHFEREESIDTLRGKLKNDLVRIHAILERATARSVIVMNEIFASTTLDDAVWLGSKVLARISELGALAICVTFMTELAAFNEQTASMVAGVDPRDPAIRTFRLERRPADGLAYALAVANKYGVTHDALVQRVTP